MDKNTIKKCKHVPKDAETSGGMEIKESKNCLKTGFLHLCLDLLEELHKLPKSELMFRLGDGNTICQITHVTAVNVSFVNNCLIVSCANYLMEKHLICFHF